MINFLTTLNLQEYISAFEAEDINDLDELRDLTDGDLKEIGLKLGTRKKILKALNTSTATNEQTTTQSIVYPTNLNPKDMVTYLAHPWDEYLREAHPSVKLHWLVDTAEVVVRWVCALLLAEIRAANDNHLPEAIQQNFKEKIARPTLGVWRHFVSELSKEKLQNPHLNGLFDIYQNELNIYGVFPEEGDDKTSLLKLRNRIAHGGGTTRSQAKEYLDIYAPRLESLLLSVNIIMSEAKLYGHFDDTCYLLHGLTSTSEECSVSIDGPYIKIDDTTLSLWPLVEFDKVRQINDNGNLEEKTSLTPQTYLRTDKQGVQYIPMGVDESYSISNKNKQEAFETIFALNVKTEKSSKIKQQEYQYDDFLKEAGDLKERLVGREDEVEILKTWIKSINSFDNTVHCGYIYGGPGLGKSMIMASIASDLSNDYNNHIFYYRFRGGDARNNKETFVRLLRDSLISWEKLRMICEEPEKLISTDDMLRDLENRLEMIQALDPAIIKFYGKEKKIKSKLRLFIDGLDEIMLQDNSMLQLIKSFQKKGIVILIATRLENGVEQLEKLPWCQEIVFDESINGLPPMTEHDIRAMLLTGISKAEKKELITNDQESEGHMSNLIVQAIAKKAEGLPLYIHLLMNDLQNNKYALTDSTKLPDGLNQYYYELVGRMGINDVDSYKAPVITLLSVLSEPIDIEAIALILNRINIAKDRESLMEKVVMAVGSLLKQVKTKEGTIGYTLYHQSFRDFINKGENDKHHPLHATLSDMKYILCVKAAQWSELPNSNLKNHLFRNGTAYTLEWQDDGLDVVKERLTNLEYLLQRAEQLPATELWNLLKEYELIQSRLPDNEQKEFAIWSSFFREKLHLISKVDEATWKPSQSLFQLAYEDGDNTPLTKQADKLLTEDKINFLWLRKRNRPTMYQRTGLLKVLQGHSSTVEGVEILEDGRILSFADDTTLRLWSSEGEELAVLKGHSSQVKGVKILEDGRILSFSDDATLRLWNSNGEELAVLKGHSRQIVGAEILKDGKVLSFSVDNTLRIWSSKGEELAVLKGHNRWVQGVKIFEDGRILSFSLDTTLRLWSSEGEELAVLEGHGNWVKGAKILEDGKILSYSVANTLRLWSSEGEELAVLKGHSSQVKGVKILEDGRILSFSDDATLRLWSSKGEELAVLKGHSRQIVGAEILKDGKVLSFSIDNTLRIWSSEGKEQAVLEGHRGPVRGVKILKDGRILSFALDNTLRLWSSKGEELAVLKGHSRQIVGAEILKDGKVLSFSVDNTLRIWSSKGEELAVLEGHNSPIKGLKTLKDGRILSFSDDATLRLWSSEGEELAVLKGHSRWIQGVEILKDGRILSFSDDATLRLWNSNGEELAVLKGHNSHIIRVNIFEDGRILSFTLDNTLRLWSSEGKELAVLKGHSGEVIGVKVLKDGRLLSFSDDATLRLWSSKGEELSVLKGHSRQIVGAEILKDGKILSFSKDKTLRLWSSEGEELAVLKGHSRWIQGIEILEDGRILSFSEDPTIRLWSSKGEELAVLRGHSSQVIGVKVLEDGRLLSYSLDATLRLWSSEGEELAVLKGHSRWVLGIEILENNRILSFSNDNTLRLWSSEGEELAVLEGHSCVIRGVVILENDKILSFSDDTTLRLWSSNGEELAVLEGHKNPIKDVKVLKDGKILSFSNDTSLRLWSNDGELLSTFNYSIESIKFQKTDEEFCVASNNNHLLLYDFYSGNQKISLSQITKEYE